MTMYGLALAHMQAQKRRVIHSYLETKSYDYPRDIVIDFILKSNLYKDLYLIAREEQEIDRGLKRRPWLLTLGKNEWRHFPKKSLECDIYYQGRKLGNG